MVSPRECSQVGVSIVQVLAYADVPGLTPGEWPLVSIDEFPCFPRDFYSEGGTVGATILSPGDYVLAIRGVRSNPDRDPWLAPDVEPPCENINDPTSCPPCIPDRDTCVEGMQTCTCRDLQVSDGQTEDFPDLVLGAPPECDDGIDGDGDGLVDVTDPGCIVSDDEAFEPSEARANLRFSFRLLGVPEVETETNIPVVCDVVGIREFRIQTADVELTTPCPAGLGPRAFAIDVEPGPQELRVWGVDAEGERVTREEVRPWIATRSEIPIDIAIDFAGDDFLAPITAPATFAPCPTTESAISHVEMRALNARGAPLIDPIALADGTLLDGHRLACADLDATVGTEALNWGAYQLEVTWYAGDTACFTTGDTPLPLTPDRAFALVPGEPVGGETSAGCPACTDDRHCEPGFACSLGQCESSL